MTGLGTNREHSQNVAPVAKGRVAENDQPRDGKIKATRCAAVGRRERGQ